MLEAFVFPECPVCEVPTGLTVMFRGAAGMTARCRECGAYSYATDASAKRQEWPSGFQRNSGYTGGLDVVKARSTWLCDNAWNSDGPLAPPLDCRVVIRRNDMRLCETYWHEVRSNLCIPCSLHADVGFWVRAHVG
jgi:hypothetical protein